MSCGAKICASLELSAALAPHIDAAAATVVRRWARLRGRTVHETEVENIASEAWEEACDRCAWLRGKVPPNEIWMAKMQALVYHVANALELEVYV